MGLSRLISTEQSVIVERPIDDVFDLLRSAVARSDRVLDIVDESPPDVPYSVWRYKVGRSSGMWLRYRITNQEPPRRLTFSSRSLGVIGKGQSLEGETLLSPIADSSVSVTTRCNIRLSLLNPTYWPVRVSAFRAQQQQSLREFAEWANSYEGAIPVPIETTRSEAVAHARQARQRRLRSIIAAVAVSVVFSWVFDNGLFLLVVPAGSLLYELDTRIAARRS